LARGPWTYCANCNEGVQLPADLEVNPARLISVDDNLNTVAWTAHGAVAVTKNFSYALRQSLLDPNALWVPSSEPADQPFANGAPRAMLLSADGLNALGALTVGPAGFDLASSVVGSYSWSRSGFAAAFSRTENALYVAGGVSAWGFQLSDVETYQNGQWSSVALADATQAPYNVRAAAYSVRDRQLWIVDNLGRSNLVLRRIDPKTGAVISYSGLAVLSGLQHVYLTALNDGHILLAGTTATGYRLAVLEATSSFRFLGFFGGFVNSISTLGEVDGTGALVSPPAIVGKTMTLGVGTSVGKEMVVQPQTFSLAVVGLR
jgi:hypothetical protein